jgi:prevent-host-death family protein
MGKHSVAEAKSHLSSLIDLALEGNEVIITRHGTPVVEIRPVAKAARPVTQADIEHLRVNRIRPKKHPTLDAGELVRQMRDEDWR